MMFSIIIPAYNVAPYLCECLDSVLAQTFTDWEAICVDDGSTDGGGAIIDEYAMKDERIRVIHKLNGGVSSARNAGIDAAQGEWLIFLDGDDLLVSSALKVIAEGIAQHDELDLIRYGYEAFKDGDEVKLDEMMQNEFRVVDISEKISFGDVFVYMWQFAYRKRMVGNLRFNLTYHRMEDRPFVCDCLFNRNKAFIGTDSKVLLYRQREGSAMHKIPSPLVWSGEIRYRIELVQMMERSGKVVPGFVSSSWIGGFYEKRCVPVMRKIKESDGLWQDWYQALDFLKDRADLSRIQAVKFRVAAQFRMRIISMMVCVDYFDYLRHDCRILKPITRLYRRIRRHGEYATVND